MEKTNKVQKRKADINFSW